MREERERPREIKIERPRERGREREGPRETKRGCVRELGTTSTAVSSSTATWVCDPVHTIMSVTSCISCAQNMFIKHLSLDIYLISLSILFYLNFFASTHLHLTNTHDLYVEFVFFCIYFPNLSIDPVLDVCVREHTINPFMTFMYVRRHLVCILRL